MQTRPDEFSGVMSSTMKIINHEGISALWKGAVPTAGGMVLENCMAFGINEGLKRAFPDDPTSNDINSPPNILKPFLMGAITGCCSATVLLPSEIIKAKTQVEIKATSSQEILKRMIQRQGFKSLFVGRLLIVTMVMVDTNTATAVHSHNVKIYILVVAQGFDAQLMRDAPFYAFFFGGTSRRAFLFLHR